MPEHKFQRTPVELNYPVVQILRKLVYAALLFQIVPLQQLGAHHWCQGQRHHRGDKNRDRQRNRKLTKQPPDNVAHEQQRNQHSDQRNRQ